jgi:hypothetical protein
MSEGNKKIEPNSEESKAAELSEKDLEQVAGGASTPVYQSPPIKGYPIKPTS